MTQVLKANHYLKHLLEFMRTSKIWVLGGYMDRFFISGNKQDKRQGRKKQHTNFP